MQKHLLPLSFALALITTPINAGWFDGYGEQHRFEGEQQRRIVAEQQLQQQRQETGGWQIIAAGLAVFTLITFGVGILLGARAIRHGKANRHK